MVTGNKTAAKSVFPRHNAKRKHTNLDGRQKEGGKERHGSFPFLEKKRKKDARHMHGHRDAGRGKRHTCCNIDIYTREHNQTHIRSDTITNT